MQHEHSNSNGLINGWQKIKILEKCGLIKLCPEMVYTPY